MTHLIPAKLGKKKKRKNASCKHVFLGPSFKKLLVYTFQPFPKTRNHTVLFSFSRSHTQPVPPVLPFHFAPSGNRKLRLWDDFKKTWVVSSCLLTDLSPPPPKKKKKNGRIFSEALVAFPRRKKTHIPPPEKTKRCVPALPFLGGGPFPLAMVDVRQPGFVKPRFFFVGWKAQWVGSSQIHQQVGER